MDTFEIIRNLGWAVYFAYTHRTKLFELAKKHKAVRYAITPFLIPVVIPILAYLFYTLQKNPDLLTSLNKPKQKKLTDYL